MTPDAYPLINVVLPEEIDAWLREVERERPDLFEKVQDEGRMGYISVVVRLVMEKSEGRADLKQVTWWVRNRFGVKQRGFPKRGLRKGTREFANPVRDYLVDHSGWHETDTLLPVMGVSRNRAANILHRLAKAGAIKHARLGNRNVWGLKA